MPPARRIRRRNAGLPSKKPCLKTVGIPRLQFKAGENVNLWEPCKTPIFFWGEVFG